MKQKRLIAPTKFRAISPAQDFINNIAYFTVSLYQEDQKTAKIVQLVITSKKDCFQLTTENLNKLSLFSDYNPRPKPRWSDHSIEKYLKGNETSDLSKTFLDVKEQLDFYIDFGDAKWSSVIALWIIGTYFFQLFNSYPYVHLNGNMASGKTKTLNIISQLAFNAELTTNSTPAYLARMINDNSATCCIDETESLQRARDEDSRTILGMYNSGYKKGSRMGKLQQKGDSKDWIPVEFNSYSPKVFAGINGLENSLASRCIPITMVRSANANLKNREITENNHLLSDIRDELYVTALDNFSIINAIYQGITDNKLVGRDWELWKPILTIAQLAEPSLKLYEEIRDFAITSTEETRQTILDTFLAPKIIQALLEGFKDDDEEEFFSFSDIELLLSRYDTDSFSWLADKKHRKHISTELRKAGVTKGQSVPKRVGDEVVKGYWISKKKLNLLLTGFG